LFSWNTGNFGTSVLLATVGGRINSLAFSPEDRLLVSGGGIERQQFVVHILDSESGRLIRKLNGHSDWVLWVGFNAAGTLLGTGSYGEICIWDTRTWDLLQVLKRPSSERFSTIAFSFSAQNEVFISGAWSHEECRHGWNVTRKGLVQLWDLRSGKLTDSIEAHDDSLCCLAYNLEKDLLASGSADGVVKIWSLSSNQEA
jgi:WD40 repeat protein